MARPRVDDLSAGLGASKDTVVSAERSEVFCDCGDGSRNGKGLEMAPCMTVQPSPLTVCGMPDAVQADGTGMDVEMIDGPNEFGDRGDIVDAFGEGRSADVLREKGDVGSPVARATCVMQAVAPEHDGGVACGGEAVPSGSRADMGQPSRTGWLMGLRVCRVPELLR